MWVKLTTQVMPLGFLVIGPYVKEAYHPGNAIMMVVDVLAPKGTSTLVNTMMTLLQILYIWVHAKHVTQHTYRITPTKQAMLKTGQYVGNPLVPLLLAGLSSHIDNTWCITTQYWTVHSW